uniref:Uncharacterized protein n=1 Tax=Solanum tuberosum TaxID=4113 RepID=M1DBF4_SOLTU
MSRIDTGLDEGFEGRNRTTPMMNNNSRIKDTNESQGRMKGKNKNKERNERDNDEQHQRTAHQQQRQVIPSSNSINPNSSQVAKAKNNAHLQIHANEQNRNLENQRLHGTVHNPKDHQEHGKQDKGQGNNANP